MGNVSTVPQTPVNFPYFSLTFKQPDKIKLVNADQETINLILNTTVAICGLSYHGWDNGAYELKFHGNPFMKSYSKETAIVTKQLACYLLGNLCQIGWRPVISTDLGRTTALTSWFFQKSPSQTHLTPPHIFCVSLSSTDKLQIINDPGHFSQILTGIAQQHLGVQRAENVWQGAFEVKLCGNPWQVANLEDGVRARRMLLAGIRQFDAQGYKLYTTANIKGTADCLFFIKDESSAPGETQYMMLSLNANDRIRLIDPPPEIIDTVRACIGQFWPQGLQDQRDYMQGLSCYEFKLSGYPWCTSGYEAVAARYLITLILQNLLNKGWAMVSGLDITRRINDKAVFILRSCQPANMHHFCLSPSDVDKLRLINAPNDLIPVAVQVINTHWTLGVARSGPNAGASYEWKLNGQPWASHYGNHYIMARHLMAVLLHEFSIRGWRAICSADVSAKYVSQENGPDYPIDVHTWFFTYTGVGSVQNTTQGQGLPRVVPPAPAVGFVATAPTAPAHSQYESPPPSYDEVVGGEKE